MKFQLDRGEDTFRELVERAITKARQLGASYADARIVISENEGIGIENGRISSTEVDAFEGMGVRLIVDGAWGFWSASNLERTPEEIVERAVNWARHLGRLQDRPVVLAPVPAAEYRYETACEQDPFAVPWEQKINLLLAADRAMQEASGKLYKRVGHISIRKSRKILATTDGVLAVQDFMFSGASIEANAQKSPEDEDKQRRSYPEAHVFFMNGGWEAIERLNLVAHAPKIAQEAEQLLFAPQAPTGLRDVILSPTQLNLHGGHEAIHGLEADRVLGTEWSLAGGSFITGILPQIGNFRYGSEHVNIVADSLDPKGVGSFACDDEGAQGQRNYLVKEGILVGLLTSRETVPQLNELLGREYFKSSGGTMRAEGAYGLPLIRMVNIFIEPGNMPLDEMKDRVPDGTLLFGTNKSWSIDDVRRHFSFGTEIAWEKVKDHWELRRNAVYRGDNLEFFRSCQGFADSNSWVQQGVGNCGKGDPIQTIPTGHGSSHGWFQKIHVDGTGQVGR